MKFLPLFAFALSFLFSVSTIQANEIESSCEEVCLADLVLSYQLDVCAGTFTIKVGNNGCAASEPTDLWARYEFCEDGAYEMVEIPVIEPNEAYIHVFEFNISPCQCVRAGAQVDLQNAVEESDEENNLIITQDCC